MRETLFNKFVPYFAGRIGEIAVYRTLFYGMMCIMLLTCEESSCHAADFAILIDRQSTKGVLIDGNPYVLVGGTISVNGQAIGGTYENNAVKIAVGTFPGTLRYWSGHNFVQGPFGTIGQDGDFLVEVSGVPPNRTDILLHGGNKPNQSAGCILLGAVPRDASGIPYLNNGDTLRKLRLLFYGTDVPNATPNKNISVEVQDHTRSVAGTWSGTEAVAFKLKVGSSGNLMADRGEGGMKMWG